MSGGGSSAPAGNTTTVQSNDPWSGQMPYLSDVFGQAQNLYQNNTPQYYPGSTVSPLTPLQTQGLSMEANMGENGGSSSVNSANGALTGIENGDMLSAGNPYFQNMASNVLSQVVPGIESTFAGGNNMNNPGAAFATAQGATAALGSIANQDYTSGLNNMVQGAALAPGIQSAQYQNPAAVVDAGTQQQTQDQAQLTNLVNQWNFQQQLPYNQLNAYDQLINGNYGGTSTTTQPYFDNGPSTSQQVSQGVGAAASLAMMAAMFSDRRLKRDIEQIGTSGNGLPIYAYRYLDHPGLVVGFMADEVETIHPEAVMMHPSGFKMVDYARAVL